MKEPGGVLGGGGDKPSPKSVWADAHDLEFEVEFEVEFEFEFEFEFEIKPGFKKAPLFFKSPSLPSVTGSF